MNPAGRAAQTMEVLAMVGECPVLVKPALRSGGQMHSCLDKRSGQKPRLDALSLRPEGLGNALNIVTIKQGTFLPAKARKTNFQNDPFNARNAKP